MRKLLTLAAAVLTLAACSKEQSADSGPMLVSIDPTIANPAVTPPLVPASRATDTDFEQGDAVGLTITLTAKNNEKFVENKQMTFNAATQTFAASDFLWYEDYNTPSSLFAYYPYVAGSTAPTEFTVQADQSGDGYTNSDLIVAVKSGVYPSKNSTPMTFKHKATRIIIAVTNGTAFEVTGISIKGAVCTGSLDPETAEFKAKAGVEPSNVKTYTADKNKTYYALLVPQNAVKLEVVVTTADAKTRTVTLGTTDLASGQNRKMNLNIQEADIEASLSGPITGWEDGDDLLPDGGGSVDSSIEWGGEKYKTVVMKDGRVWMAENLRYLPAGKSAEEDFTKDAGGIWYPLVAQYDEVQSKYVAVVSKDQETLKKQGYLYTFATAMGVAEITEANSATFESKQGICPDGWHVPSQAEWTALIAAYPSDTNGKSDIATIQAAGFSCPLTGMRMKNTSALVGSVSGATYEDHIMAGYMMSSTKDTYSVNTATGAITTRNKVLMVMSNKSNTNISISNSSNLAGIPVRCIKNVD